MRPGDRGRWASEHHVALLLCLLASAGFVAHCLWLRVNPVDDAAISVSYALSIVSGAGPRLTPESQVVEGFSNPLWTALLAISFPLRLPPLPFATALGIGLGALSLLAFALWGPAAQGRALRIEDAAGAMLAASVSCFAGWSASGMETGLHALLVGCSGALLLAELRKGRGALCGVALGLLCLTRPEGPLYVATAAVFWIAYRARERRWPGRQELAIALWLAALAGGYELLRWIVFAAPLPNSYYAKRLWDFGASAYLRGFVGEHRLLMGGAAAGLTAALAAGGAARRSALLAAAFLGAGTLFVCTAGGDWMREWRFVAPLVPAVGALWAAGLAGLREHCPEAFPWLAPTAAAVAAAVPLAAAPLQLQRSPGVRQNLELPASFVVAQLAEPVRRLAAVGMRRPLVGVPDIGGAGLTLRRAEIVDLGGLADVAVAWHAGNSPALEDYLVAEGLPSLIDLHGPSLHLARALLSHYWPLHGTSYVLRGLTADEDPRCPGGKTAALSDPASLPSRIEILAADRPREALALLRCAIAYLEQPPDPAWRRSLAEAEDARGDAHLRAGEVEEALRHFSLAAVLERGDARRRRKTEQCRERLFPRMAR